MLPRWIVPILLTLSLAIPTSGGCSSTSAGADAGPGDPLPNDRADDRSVAGDVTADDATEGGSDAIDSGLWQSLFNGVDLTGWTRYLGKPSDADPPLGLENDPRGVYTVVTLDGEPAIRISGEIWGALISQQIFQDVHLRMEYRWGQRNWPPLNAFDSGIMVLSTGPLGAVNAGGPALSNPIGSGGFLVSMEYQLSPGDIGALYNLGPIAYRMDRRAVLADLPQTWNQVDIVIRSGTVENFLNGQSVAAGSDFQVTWPGQAPMPLTEGKVQLQSEGGEIYFRRLAFLPLP